MLWLSLYFPSLQLDSLLVDNQYGVSKVIIVDSKSNDVVQLNELAYQEGVRVGMGLATAASLCHELTVLPYQEQQEHNMLMQLCQQLYHVSADIVINGANELLLKVSHMLPMYNGLSTYWQALADTLALFEYRYYAATAYSPEAATVLAKSMCHQITDERLLIEQQLNLLPISALFIEKSVYKQLQRVGVKTLAQLQQLSISELALRFSKQTVIYFQAIHNRHDADINTRPWFVFYQAQDEFSYELTLLFDIHAVKLLLVPIKKVLAQLEIFVTRKSYAHQQLRLSLILREQPSVELYINSAEPLTKACDWLQLILLRISSLKLTAAVIAISLNVKDFQQQQGHIKDLYTGRVDALAIDQLTTLLLNKLGENKVHALCVSNEHQPEKSATYQAVFSLNKGVNESLSYTFLRQLRPSFLLARPIPLAEQVDVIHGPERIQTAWWRGQPISRDYFIARNVKGQWHWLYKQPDEQWFIHGYFA